MASERLTKQRMTGIAVKSGVLQSQEISEELRAELNELESLAVEAVSLVRQLNQ